MKQLSCYFKKKASQKNRTENDKKSKPKYEIKKILKYYKILGIKKSF